MRIFVVSMILGCLGACQGEAIAVLDAGDNGPDGRVTEPDVGPDSGPDATPDATSDSNDSALDTPGDGGQCPADSQPRPACPHALTYEATPSLTRPEGVDSFGLNMAMSGDGNVVVTYSSLTEGVVHVFTRSGRTWTSGAELPPPETGAVGRILAVAGDGTLIAVGDPDGGVDAHGLVYLYQQVDGVWALTQTVLAPEAAENFGLAIDISLRGDVFVVSDRTGPGTVFVFRRSGQTWSLDGRLVNPNERTQNFGSDIALSADAETVVVADAFGGPGGAGSVVAFVRAPGGWQRFNLPRPESNSPKGPTIPDLDFGRSVAVSADGQTIAVGTANVPGGVVQVYTRNGPGWDQGTTVPTQGLYRGDGVALSADGTLLVVSDIAADEERGAVQVYQRCCGGWDSGISLPHPTATESFGGNVYVSGSGSVVAVSGTYSDLVAVFQSTQ